MSAWARAGQQAARLLRGGMTAARSRLPEGENSVVRLLRSLSSRVDWLIGRLEVRARRKADEDSRRFYELGRSLFAQRRYEECLDT